MSSCQNESFVNTSRKLLENRNETFPVVRYGKCVVHMETRVSLRYLVSYCRKLSG